MKTQSEYSKELWDELMSSDRMRKAALNVKLLDLVGKENTPEALIIKEEIAAIDIKLAHS